MHVPLEVVEHQYFLCHIRDLQQVLALDHRSHCFACRIASFAIHDVLKPDSESPECQLYAQLSSVRKDGRV
jgi:hypothetical protein